jgi:PPM family protein phosphatase
MTTVILYARTDIGLVRTNNEDSYFADPERGLAIVADGMGGHAGGEVASKIAVDTISDGLKPPDSIWPFGRAQRERNLILDSIRRANRRVRDAAEQDAALTGMGTTVVVLWVRGVRAHVAHVGDSRIYRYRKGGLVQLTRDHSWVAVDHRVLDVAPGDIFLLCSDGLTGPVGDDGIVTALREFKNGEEASQRLIDLAKENGAPDNVTVVLAYC